MRRSLLTYCLTAFFALFLTTSCSDNPSSAQEDPPELPPPSSMKMDFSEFNNQNTQQNTNSVTTIQNFSRAVVTASILKVVVDVNLVIPRVLLTAAANADAEFNGEGEWEWQYSKTEGNYSYSVRLVAARQEDDSVDWNFYVTNSDLNLDDQLFFSGTTNQDGTEGTWSYYNLQNTDSQEQVSTISWSVDGEDNVQLELEVTSDFNNNLGDSISYNFDGTVKSATYYNANNDETIELQLNTETNAGFIVAPDYNNGAKACWDSGFQDISCEEI